MVAALPKFCWVAWLIGTGLITLSWVSVVSPQVDFLGKKTHRQNAFADDDVN